jgi:coenzyme F420-reducing hydrogenase gamma subunit
MGRRLAMSGEKKPRVAFFDFACCEGCQLTVLELEEKLLDLLAKVEVVSWREVMTGESDSYDIAFCEGSITRQEDVTRIETIRKTADILVSLGACASIGCHNALKNRWSMEELLNMTYGENGRYFDTIAARPITAVVEVDYQVQGCPLSLAEFVTVFKHILTGQDYQPPNEPVCVECKLNDNLCVYEKGIVCLGPVTRCGCNAICTAYGDPCHGCRGLIDEANLKAAVKVLRAEKLHSIMAAAAQKHQLSEEEIRAKFAVYNNWPELDLEEKSAHGE